MSHKTKEYLLPVSSAVSIGEIISDTLKKTSDFITD